MTSLVLYERSCVLLEPGRSGMTLTVRLINSSLGLGQTDVLYFTSDSLGQHASLNPHVQLVDDI